jgi:hypothetical protein
MGGTDTSWSDQRSVVSESGIPSFAAKRAPALPVLAKPIAWIAIRNRSVRREKGRKKSGRRSVKILRGQVATRQKNFFTKRGQKALRFEARDEWPPCFPVLSAWKRGGLLSANQSLRDEHVDL